MPIGVVASAGMKPVSIQSGGYPETWQHKQLAVVTVSFTASENTGFSISVGDTLVICGSGTFISGSN